MTGNLSLTAYHSVRSLRQSRVVEKQQFTLLRRAAEASMASVWYQSLKIFDQSYPIVTTLSNFCLLC